MIILLKGLIIQHSSTGLYLVEFKHESKNMESGQSETFNEFLTEIQNVKKKLDIETNIIISNKESHRYNCILISKISIDVILLIERDDSIDLWRKKGELIAKKFIDMYGENFDPNEKNKFKDFTAAINDFFVNEKFGFPDKDIELVKIELYSEHTHSRYITMLPSMIAIFLAFVIAFWTFFIEGILTLEGFFIALIIFSIPNFLGVYRFIRKFKKNMKKISEYLEKVKNGEALPKLAEI